MFMLAYACVSIVDTNISSILLWNIPVVLELCVQFFVVFEVAMGIFRFVCFRRYRFLTCAKVKDDA